MKYKCVGCGSLSIKNKVEFLCQACKQLDEDLEQDEELQVDIALLKNPSGKTKAWIEEDFNLFEID